MTDAGSHRLFDRAKIVAKHILRCAGDKDATAGPSVSSAIRYRGPVGRWLCVGVFPAGPGEVPSFVGLTTSRPQKNTVAGNGHSPTAASPWRAPSAPSYLDVASISALSVPRGQPFLCAYRSSRDVNHHATQLQFKGADRHAETCLVQAQRENMGFSPIRCLHPQPPSGGRIRLQSATAGVPTKCFATCTSHALFSFEKGIKSCVTVDDLVDRHLTKKRKRATARVCHGASARIHRRPSKDWFVERVGCVRRESSVGFCRPGMLFRGSPQTRY
jgi:hypothetical protein